MTKGVRRAAILAFHAVEDGPAPLSIPPAAFERQVGALADMGAVVLTAGELVEALRTGADLADPAVAFTFDDGYESVHRVALPVLAAHGYRATVLPVTGRLGATSDWSADGGSLRLLSATQLAELAAAGWEVGGHTHTHR
ncbi:MAG: polysaccharide deacetylase family protein, partial [Acidimicrobiales bacterium]